MKMAHTYKNPNKSALKNNDDLGSMIPKETDEDEDLVTKELLDEEYALIHG
jgi:hypothetical protein